MYPDQASFDSHSRSYSDFRNYQGLGGKAASARLNPSRSNVCSALALLAALCLSACASFWLSGGLPLLKIAPATLGIQTVEQRAIITWPGGQKTMEMALDVNDDTLTVIGLAFGARLFSFDYDGEKIIETKPLPDGFSAVRIVNDLMLAYAPPDALRAALPSGWTVHEEKGARQIFLNGKLNISIRYAEGSPWQGRVALDNHALYYRLTLDSSETTSDAP
ncbi:MAG: DUF3261 domain-containing protein [Betaproteobacteria bacterium]|nr:DUF3261 domain-containing protein [Betaproteobacteria bacterium]